MSASTERKNRQAAREAGTDKKTIAQEKEAQEQAKSKLRWTLGTAAVALVVVLVLLLNSPLVSRMTAYSVGDTKFSTAEVSYRYASQYYSFANQYGSYASLFGLDTSSGIHGLDKQPCSMTDGGTWKDYFLQSAESEMVETAILCGYAKDNGVELDDDDQNIIDSAFDGFEEQAKSYGYANGDKMLAASYGSGVNQELVRKIYRESLLAQKASEALSDSFTYTQEQIDAQYASYEGSRDYFDYAYCYVAAEKVESEAAEGEEPVSAPTEETLAAAKSKAEAVAAAYEAAAGDSPAMRLVNAAASEGQSGSQQTRVLGSGVPAALAWMCDEARQEGDVTVEATDSGCYVMVFLAHDDNHYPTANVRHILIKAVAGDDGSYSEEAKAAAKARAEEILAEFMAGDQSEDSFAALAEQYSEDTGSNTNGGLYENVSKGQMVQEFNDFCFAGHKPGDTGIVYGESSSYAGYHVMYFVGEGDLYSNVIAENALRTDDYNAWMEAAKAANPAKEGFGMKFVG